MDVGIFIDPWGYVVDGPGRLFKTLLDAATGVLVSIFLSIYEGILSSERRTPAETMPPRLTFRLFDTATALLIYFSRSSSAYFSSAPKI